jgi:glycosyltransferase involved in cell wall biosynthesis
MIHTPKVSVVVPVYRVEKTLKQCVDSLRCQTLQEIEIILVDDGSPDQCPQMCDDYAAQDSRIRVIHQKNGGLLRARICGVNEAVAPYVGFVDSDDFVAPTFLETLYQAAAESMAQLVCTSFWMYWNERHRTFYDWPFPSGLFEGERLEKEFYPLWFEDRKIGRIGLVKAVWCKLFERELLRDVYTRVAPQVNIGEDLITTYAVAALAERIMVLPKVALYEYRQSDSSMMSGYWRGFYQNETAAFESLSRMPCRKEALPFVEEGLKRYRAYMMYDILYNECRPTRTSTHAERSAIAKALTSESAWQEAARLDVLSRSGDNQTSRLLRKLILRRRPRLMLAVLWLAVLKNKGRQVFLHGR